MAGYHLTFEEREVLERIADNMNNASYSNSKFTIKPLPTIDEINNFLLKIKSNTSNNPDYMLESFSLSVLPSITLNYKKRK
jgi:molecular chaperone GrpE (heat shock protein)